MKKDFIEKQEQANRLVAKHILHNLCLTAEKMLEDNPELLLDAENYKEDKESGEYPEIFEYWAISDWLGDRLKEEDEIVFEMLDFTVWGRKCTGQAIKLDNVIQEIAEKYNF